MHKVLDSMLILVGIIMISLSLSAIELTPDPVEMSDIWPVEYKDGYLGMPYSKVWVNSKCNKLGIRGYYKWLNW